VLHVIRSSRSGSVRNCTKQPDFALVIVLVVVLVLDAPVSRTTTTTRTIVNVAGWGDLVEILLSESSGGNAAALR